MISVGIAAHERFLDFAAFRPLTSYLADRADRVEPAFTFFDYAEVRSGVEHSLTWQELDVRARAVAATLRRTTAPGERVAILAPHDLSYVIGFLGALYAGVIAVPAFPPDVDAHSGRLSAMLTDCAASVWLTSEAALSSVLRFADEQPELRPEHVVAVDDVELALAEGFVAVPVSMDQPAYLQYSSGATGQPSGSIITHRALSANAQQLVAACPLDENSTLVGWVPFFHDMGLMHQLCVPVFGGAHSVFMSPFAFIRKPVRWLNLLSGYPNVIAAAPNFAFEYAATRVSEHDRAAVDLTGVQILLNGSEPVRADTVDLFLRTFGPHGFAANAHRPAYGLAEATVFVSTSGSAGPTIVDFDRDRLAEGVAVAVGDEHRDPLRLVSAGVVIGQHARIVDPLLGKEKAAGEVGEIWVHGANLADGYWRQPERSEEIFAARLVDAPAGTPTERWLRTGDLGVIYANELFITGRSKDLIIVAGRNHYPQDIESTVQDAHQAIRRGHVAVFGIDSGTGERAVAVAEYSPHVAPADRDPEVVARAVQKAVAERHDLRLGDFVLVKPGTVLRTSSGKVARTATKQHFLAGGFDQDSGTA